MTISARFIAIRNTNRPDYPEIKLNFDEELSIITAEIMEIRECMEIGRISKDTLKSRLVHLLKRTDRLKSENLSEEQTDPVQKVMVSVLSLLDSISSAGEPPSPELNLANLIVDSNDSDTSSES